MCLWPSNDISHLVLLHLVIKLLNKNKKPQILQILFLNQNNQDNNY